MASATHKPLQALRVDDSLVRCAEEEVAGVQPCPLRRAAWYNLDDPYPLAAPVAAAQRRRDRRRRAC